MTRKCSLPTPAFTANLFHPFLVSRPFTSPAFLSKCFSLHSPSFLHLPSPQALYLAVNDGFQVFLLKFALVPLAVFSPCFLSMNMCMCVCVLSCFRHVQLFAALWTVACQAPLSMGFSRQEYWSGLPYPPPGDLSHPGIEPTFPVTSAVQADSLTTKLPGQPLLMHTQLLFSVSFAPFLSSTRPYNVWSLLLHLRFSLLYLNHNFIYTITYMLMISTSAIPP